MLKFLFVRPSLIGHLLISIISSFCWNAEVLICKAFSDWSKFCLLLSFCYLKLYNGLLTACSIVWNDMI